MAMASNPNRNNGEAESSQTFRNSNRRVDPARGHSNVPVLFRLKNLQRTEATGVSAESAAEVREVENDSRSLRSAAAMNSKPVTRTSRPQQEPTVSPPASASHSTQPEPQPTTPITAIGKRGVSNGFILFAVAIAVAFAIGRSSGKSTMVATKPPVPPAAVAPLAPLTPPQLPRIAATEPATVKDQEQKVIGTSQAEVELSTASEQNLDKLAAAAIPSGSAEDQASIQEEKLPVPKMLAAEKSQTSEDKLGTLNDDFISPTDRQGSLASDTKLNEISSEPADSDDSLPSLAPNAPVMPSDGQSSFNESVVTNETSSQNRAKLVTTSMPDIDTAKLYEMRANYQSQMEALARARQAQPSATTIPASQPPMQYASSHSMPVGQSFQPNIAPPTQGYGSNQFNTDFAAPAPNAGYAASQPATGYGQVPASTVDMSQPYAASSRYTPIGSELTNPMSVPPNQPTPPAAYQPLFSAPPSKPAEGQTPFSNSY